MFNFACDQHTLQPFATQQEFIKRSYMISSVQTPRLHGSCKSLQFNSAYHTAASFNGVRFLAIHLVISYGYRELHRSDTSPRVVQAEGV